MQRKLITIVFSICLMMLASLATAQTTFKATIDEAQAGGTGSAATGNAVLVLNKSMDALAISVTFEGITTAQMSAFHIHNGDVGMSGGVVFGFISPNHDVDGDFMDLGNGIVSEWDSNDNGSSLASQLTDLQNEGLYFNVHTPANPGGEIRGQIVTVLFGDINLSGTVDLLDVTPFVNLISSGDFQIEGDFDGDGVITLLDVGGFIDALSGT